MTDPRETITRLRKRIMELQEDLRFACLEGSAEFTAARSSYGRFINEESLSLLWCLHELDALLRASRAPAQGWQCATCQAMFPTFEAWVAHDVAAHDQPSDGADRVAPRDAEDAPPPPEPICDKCGHLLREHLESDPCVVTTKAGAEHRNCARCACTRPSHETPDAPDDKGDAEDTRPLDPQFVQRLRWLADRVQAAHTWLFENDDISLAVEESQRPHLMSACTEDHEGCNLVSLVVAARKAADLLASARQEAAPTSPRNEWRLDDLGLLDDVVVDRPETFRLERMSDDYIWGAVYHRDGSRTAFHIVAECVPATGRPRLSLTCEPEAAAVPLPSHRAQNEEEQDSGAKADPVSQSASPCYRVTRES